MRFYAYGWLIGHIAQTDPTLQAEIGSWSWLKKKCFEFWIQEIVVKLCIQSKTKLFHELNSVHVHWEILRN